VSTTLLKYIEDISRNLGVLINDVRRMAVNVENKQKEEVSQSEDELQKKPKQFSMKSFQPVTRLRKNKKEIEDAKQNPELTFINDKLKDIFGS